MLETIQLTPCIGTEIKADRDTLLSGREAAPTPLARGTRCQNWATQRRFVYQHEWTLGDLLIWDNTGTMHRVLPYAFDSGRMMHRTTLVGEEQLV